MKLPLFRVIHPSSRRNRQHIEDLMYTAMFVVGAPAMVMGSMYLVETVFKLLWR